MKKYTLYIKTRDSFQEIPVEEEVSIGRTELADVVIDDVGLSRVNTTFFIDGGMLLAVDENSLNGTFLNGEKIGPRPVRVLDGDILKIGSETEIRVEIGRAEELIGEARREETAAATAAEEKAPPPRPKPIPPPAPSAAAQKPPLIVIAAVVSMFAIVFFAVIAYIIVSGLEKKEERGGRTGGTSRSRSEIPVRVIDPLGGVDPENIDEIFSSWEVQEGELDPSEVDDIKVDTTSTEKEEINLVVSREYYRQQLNRSKAPRNGPTGVRPAGLIVLPELRSGFGKQPAKIREMQSKGYKLPLDFADLAEKRLNKKLVEMPLATEHYVLNVGERSNEQLFTSFSFETKPWSLPISMGSPDFLILSRLASNFSGQKYDLNTPRDRRQIKMRLLRTFHPSAKPVLEKLAREYQQKFNYPLRVTSLTRSMEYQISLNKNNANSFRVRGAGSLPPHTSSCTFDLARKFMTAEEQNFLIQKLAELERQGVVDALIEYGINACFHVFILQGCEA